MTFMKIVSCKTICLLFFSFLFHHAGAQVLNNNARAREKHFLYEVKQVDEFFERFNNDTGSFIREVYKTRHVKYKLDRPALIKSLFNYESQTWDQQMIDNFVNDAAGTKNQQKLNF